MAHQQLVLPVGRSFTIYCNTVEEAKACLDLLDALKLAVTPRGTSLYSNILRDLGIYSYPMVYKVWPPPIHVQYYRVSCLFGVGGFKADCSYQEFVDYCHPNEG